MKKLELQDLVSLINEQLSEQGLGDKTEPGRRLPTRQPQDISGEKTQISARLSPITYNEPMTDQDKINADKFYRVFEEFPLEGKVAEFFEEFKKAYKISEPPRTPLPNRAPYLAFLKVFNDLRGSTGSSSKDARIEDFFARFKDIFVTARKAEE